MLNAWSGLFLLIQVPSVALGCMLVGTKPEPRQGLNVTTTAAGGDLEQSGWQCDIKWLSAVSEHSGWTHQVPDKRVGPWLSWPPSLEAVEVCGLRTWFCGGMSGRWLNLVILRVL